MNRKLYQGAAIGLDIGSASVRCVIGLTEENGTPSIIGVGEAANDGVRKGVVVDIEETVTAITHAVDEAERMAGVRADHATVGINGAHLITVNSHGVIAIGATARDITDQDLFRAEEAAGVIQLPPNREIIQAFPRSYQIDGQDNIKDPVGMSAMRLEVDSCLVTAATPFLKNLIRATHQAGVRVDGLIANPLAAASVLADKTHRERGSVLIDFGANTTGVAVFEEGDLLFVGVLPMGSAHITNDLAIGLRTEIETAEKIKLEYVDGDPRITSRSSDRNIKVKELSGEDLIVSLREINMIAHARLEEIFGMVDNELKKIKREGMLPGGVIICGGGANLTHLADFVKEELRLPARVVTPAGFTGIVDKVGGPGYATAIGLMVENLHMGRGRNPLSLVLGIFDPLRNVVSRAWKKLRS